MPLTRPRSDGERGASAVEYALLVSVITLVFCAAIWFTRAHDTRSDFYVAGSEDETATYDEGIDYDGTFCDLVVRVTKQGELNLVTAHRSGENCQIEAELDLADGSGFRSLRDYEIEEENPQRFAHPVDLPVDFAFRLCHVEGSTSDDDCRVFRLSAA